MSIGMQRVHGAGELLICVGEFHVGGSFSPIKSFKGRDKKRVEWDAEYFAFEEATGKRGHDGDDEFITQVLVERGLTDPRV